MDAEGFHFAEEVGAFEAEGFGVAADVAGTNEDRLNKSGSGGRVAWFPHKVLLR